MTSLDPAPRAILSDDTSADAEQVQIDIWRRMSPPEIADLVAGASRSLRAIALAGLRARHPDLPEADLMRELHDLILGRDLAARAYGPRTAARSQTDE